MGRPVPEMPVTVTETASSLEENTPDILLVDDDAAVRRSIQLLLRAHGYNVKSYGLGSALVADPAAAGARCLITDYRMPQFDGFTILRLLRQGGWPGNAILLTAYHSRELAAEAMDEGFGAALPKPVAHHELLEAIRRALA